MDCGADEGDGLGLAGIPLVHLGDVVHTGTLLARVIAWCQWRAVQSSFAVWDGVFHDHVRSGTAGKRQKKSSLGKHGDS